MNPFDVVIFTDMENVVEFIGHLDYHTICFSWQVES
jgi:hypothetical protein